MGKNQFLKYFQNNMADAVKDLLMYEWGLDEYEVKPEYRYLAGQFAGIIDIAIESKENKSCILAIEIEHLSSYDQAKRNIEKMKEWTHKSNYRACGLMHVFHDNSHIKLSQLDSLVEYAKVYEKKGLGFHYDFVFYKIYDWRAYKQTAEEFVKSKDFQSRLWLLMGMSGMR